MFLLVSGVFEGLLRGDDETVVFEIVADADNADKSSLDGRCSSGCALEDVFSAGTIVC